jgi:hypothetical protein
VSTSKAAKEAADKTRTTAKRKTRKTTSRTPTRRAPAAASAPAGPRRAVFVDVENTTGEAQLLRVLESLAIDRKAQPTELTAVGNWRTMGQRIARRLANLGARLVHSAPVAGVRDWSDLWIATSAGCWLGRSSPGDTLEIISDDRAFDAVGDLAASLGVQFRRVSHRAAAPAVESEQGTASRKQRRGGRRRRSGRPAQGPPRPEEPPATVADEEAQPAPLDSIHALLQSLSGGRAGGWVNLDVLEGALKERGFRRPPGSPRLVTRLRKSKDFEVSSHGTVRLSGEAR